MATEKTFETFYYTDWTCEEEEYGIACAPLNTPMNIVPENQFIDFWEPPLFYLEDGAFSDYLANDRGLFLCSNKLKDIIDENKSYNDDIQWLKIDIEIEDQEKREYFILHIPKYLDALDQENTKFTKSGKKLIATVPALSTEKIGDHKIFQFDNQWRQIFSKELKETIEKKSCTGIVFGELYAIG